MREADPPLAALLDAVARRTATGKVWVSDPLRIAAAAVAARITTTTEATQ